MFAVGFSFFSGVSWLKVMERIGAGIEASIAWCAQWREEREDRKLGAIATAEREAVVERSRDDDFEREPVIVVPPVVAVQKSERVVKEKQRPLFTDMPDSPLPPLSLLEDAPPASEMVSAPRRSTTRRG